MSAVEVLNKVLEENYSLENVKIELTPPPKKGMGDLAFACFPLAKQLKKSPLDIALELEKVISGNLEGTSIEKVETAGPYLNFYLSSESFTDDFSEFMKGDIYAGLQSKNNEETIYIDYIGANVGKPLHIGHMCTPSQGQVFVNLFKKLGYTTIADSHIGDWGIIFGKLIVAYEKYGDESLLEENAVEHLFDLYVKISGEAEKNSDLDSSFREAFKKLSSGDGHMKEIWAKFTKKSIQAMGIQLSRIQVFPDYNIGESFYEGLGLDKMEQYPDLKYSMKDIVQELIQKGIATQNDDGSVGIVFPDDMKTPSCILQKRDGTHGYLASDLASVKYRMDNWNPQKILYFVDVRQQLHLRQTFEISRMAGWLDEKTEIFHAHNGFISLKEGAMSTRKGKIIKLEALLDEGEKKAADIMREKRSDISEEKLKELSKIISVGAIKYGYLKKSRTSDVIFDWDEFMSFEGNSGPYIQYAYVRAVKILSSQEDVSFDALTFSKNEEKDLIQKILKFPDVITEISSNYMAHILCQYTYDLTKSFSAFYNNVPILSEKEEAYKKSRLALTAAFVKIVEESFEILAIPLPDEM